MAEEFVGNTGEPPHLGSSGADESFVGSVPAQVVALGSTVARLRTIRIPYQELIRAERRGSGWWRPVLYADSGGRGASPGYETARTSRRSGSAGFRGAREARRGRGVTLLSGRAPQAHLPPVQPQARAAPPQARRTGPRARTPSASRATAGRATSPSPARPADHPAPRTARRAGGLLERDLAHLAAGHLRVDQRAPFDRAPELAAWRSLRGHERMFAQSVRGSCSVRGACGSSYRCSAAACWPLELASACRCRPSRRPRRRLHEQRRRDVPGRAAFAAAGGWRRPRRRRGSAAAGPPRTIFDSATAPKSR